MNTTALFAAVRTSLYGGKLNDAQVQGIEAIVAAFATYGDGDSSKLAYLLATAHHETGQYKWLHEIWGPTAAQKGYEGRADLGNNQAGDGKRFMGRGYCHITGRRNYADWAKRLGIDIVTNPDFVMKPGIAARILVQGSMLGTFTGKKLADYIGGGKVDFTNARRVINGTDKAALIAGYAVKFADAIRKADVPVAPINPAPASPPARGDPPLPVTVGGSLVAALIEKAGALDARIASAASEIDAIREAQAALQSDLRGLA